MKRKIAAILCADVVGYSRLVADDEEDALRRLMSYRGVFEAFISGANGRIFNTAGDAILAEFSSAVEAVRAAIDIQESLRTRNLAFPKSRQMSFRIGITIGDVVEQDGDLLGDAVNIAARLQTLSQPGGICLSQSVREQVSNKLSAQFRDLGPQSVKNIPQEIHAFTVELGEPPVPEAIAAPAAKPSRVPVAAIALVLVALIAGAALAYFFLARQPEPRMALTDPVPTATVAESVAPDIADAKPGTPGPAPRAETAAAASGPSSDEAEPGTVVADTPVAAARPVKQPSTESPPDVSDEPSAEVATTAAPSGDVAQAAAAPAQTETVMSEPEATEPAAETQPEPASDAAASTQGAVAPVSDQPAPAREPEPVVAEDPGDADSGGPDPVVARNNVPESQGSEVEPVASVDLALNNPQADAGTEPATPMPVARPQPDFSPEPMKGQYFHPLSTPFVCDDCRARIARDFASGGTHRAVAINIQGDSGWAWDWKTVKGASDDALNRCKSHNGQDCELFAVDSTIVWERPAPVLPNRPWVRADAPPEPFKASGIAHIGDNTRDKIAEVYPSAEKPKAVAVGPDGSWSYFYGGDSDEEVMRRALEACSYHAEDICLIAALNDQLVNGGGDMEPQDVARTGHPRTGQQ